MLVDAKKDVHRNTSKLYCYGDEKPTSSYGAIQGNGGTKQVEELGYKVRPAAVTAMFAVVPRQDCPQEPESNYLGPLATAVTIASYYSMTKLIIRGTTEDEQSHAICSPARDVYTRFGTLLEHEWHEDIFAQVRCEDNLF